MVKFTESGNGAGDFFGHRRFHGEIAFREVPTFVHSVEDRVLVRWLVRSVSARWRSASSARPARVAQVTNTISAIKAMAARSGTQR